MRGADDRREPVGQRSLRRCITRRQRQERAQLDQAGPGWTAGSRSAVAERTMTPRYLARLTATLSRLRLSRNEIPRERRRSMTPSSTRTPPAPAGPGTCRRSRRATSGSPAASNMLAQQQHLGVVRRDHQHVVLAQRAGAVLVGPRRAEQALRSRRRSRPPPPGCSVELPSWSTVSIRTPGRSPSSRRAAVTLLGVQPAVVGQPRHRPRTPRGASGRSGRGSSRALRAACPVAVDEPAERRRVDRFGVGALADLGQLLRVAEQHQVAGRAGHRDGVGQAELAGLLDHQQVEAAARPPGCRWRNPMRCRRSRSRRWSAMNAA